MANPTEQELLQCSIKFHNFVAKVGDVTIKCEIIKMEDSLYLWIGDSANSTMDDLSFSFTSNCKTQPIATKIMGAVADATSTNIARRFSIKLGKPVYVSFNVTADNMLLLGIEKRVQEEFKMHNDLLSFEH
ncbi:proteasome assembly chaperone 4-like [Nylanderia fulva]|uniref:proteasome assembly chaperone 4-like n=1 Tax=Nylanderia fulva TaxID=613905 RepID=UPI0010FB1529|nr:proteasome assembly chaperone 4-like [Nylanderia fulva]